jgi:hypothetical protein
MGIQTLLPEHYDVLPLTLWSPLQQQLAACDQAKGTPDQWAGTLRNFEKKGVSAVEIKWSRILEVLDGHPADSLHRDELLAILAANPPCELVLQRHITDEYVPRVRYEKQQRPDPLPPVEVRQGRRFVRLLHYADRTFGLCVWLHVEVDVGLFGRTRYWSFSVPRGGKKLAPHPVGRCFATLQEAMWYGRALVRNMARRLAREGFVGHIQSLNHFARYVLPGGKDYTEWLISAPNLPVEYLGDHFDLPNIVAHVRSTERTTPEGARLLVLEEIQSDWNQELRSAIQEVRTRHPGDESDNDMIRWDDDMAPPPMNPYLNHWLAAALRMMLLHAAQQGFAGLAWLPGRIHAERFPWANAEGLITFYDHIVPAAVEKLAKSWEAHLDTAHFSTLSRRFAVRKLAGKEKWIVCNLASGQSVGEEFSEPDKAETFRRSKEGTVVESVTALPISDEMRKDIQANGLPCLGSVGKRLAVMG